MKWFQRPIRATLLVAAGILGGYAALSAPHSVATTAIRPQKSGLSDKPEWDVSRQSRRFPGKGRYKNWIEANRSYDYGLSRLKRGRPTSAIRLFKQAIERYPYDFAYYEALGAAYRETGRLDIAETTLRQGVALNKWRWGLWYNLGVVLTQEKKFTEGRSALLRAKSLGAPHSRRKMIDKLVAAIDEANRQKDATTRAGEKVEPKS